MEFHWILLILQSCIWHHYSTFIIIHRFSACAPIQAFLDFISSVLCYIISVYHSSQYTYSYFPGVLFTSMLYIILSKPLAAFHTTAVREEWILSQWLINSSNGSNRPPPVLKSCTQPTELERLALSHLSISNAMFWREILNLARKNLAKRSFETAPLSGKESNL